MKSTETVMFAEIKGLTATAHDGTLLDFDQRRWAWHASDDPQSIYSAPATIRWIDLETGDDDPVAAEVWRIANILRQHGFTVRLRNDHAEASLERAITKREVGRVLKHSYRIERIGTDILAVYPVIWGGQVHEDAEQHGVLTRNARILFSRHGVYYIQRPGRQMRVYYNDQIGKASYCRLNAFLRAARMPHYVAHPLYSDDSLPAYDLTPTLEPPDAPPVVRATQAGLNYAYPPLERINKTPQRGNLTLGDVTIHQGQEFTHDSGERARITRFLAADHHLRVSLVEYVFTDSRDRLHHYALPGDMARMVRAVK